MFELTEIASHADIRAQVFPIVLPDAQIYDPFLRLQYIRYWEERKGKLEGALREVGAENLQGFREELDMYAKIRAMIASITHVLRDMNALTPDKHTSSGFESLIQTVRVRVSE